MRWGLNSGATITGHLIMKMTLTIFEKDLYYNKKKWLHEIIQKYLNFANVHGHDVGPTWVRYLMFLR